MIISIIAGIGKANELGKGNQLLWQLPKDMKHFRDLTTDHTVIMGRKTFESIGRPLPKRRNIVITRDTTYRADGVEVVHSLDEALQLAALEQGRGFEENQDEVELFIIGGAEIYAQALPRANRLYITHVGANFDADTFFPTIGPEWKEYSHKENTPDDDHAYPYTFTTYQKTT